MFPKVVHDRLGYVARCTSATRLDSVAVQLARLSLHVDEVGDTLLPAAPAPAAMAASGCWTRW
jgi:hypothetical protein